MKGLNKFMLRIAIIASYVLIVASIIAGVSAILAYLNTGADRSSMLHTGIRDKEMYLPKMEWSPLSNEGRPMDQETLKSLQTDYAYSWFVQQVAYNTNEHVGINDYFTENARKNLYQFIEHNEANDIRLESTTMEHHPSLEFFSEDGQLAVISDRNVIEYKRVFKDNTMLYDIKERSDYKVIMLLEDGFYRVRHKVRTAIKELPEDHSLVLAGGLNIKGINYYPQETPWDMFGSEFRKDTIDKDFKIIKGAGLNTVRIFLQYEDFGKANIDQEKLSKLVQVLDVAEANRIKAIVTLFDFYGDYSVLNWTLDQRHAESIVSHLKDHKAILAWDIKNEPDLDYDSRGRDLVNAWLENMIRLVRSIDQDHPITIGWSNTGSATTLVDKVDFVSFHYYKDLKHLDPEIKSLKQVIRNKPMVLQEFGQSSYGGFWRPFGGSEKRQALYHKEAQEIISNNNLPYFSWTLYDFDKIPKEVVGSLPWRKSVQKQFGFIDASGDAKEAFKYISRK